MLKFPKIKEYNRSDPIRNDLEFEQKKCDCKSKYCKHYESDFDRFIKKSK